MLVCRRPDGSIANQRATGDLLVPSTPSPRSGLHMVIAQGLRRKRIPTWCGAAGSCGLNKRLFPSESVGFNGCESSSWATLRRAALGLVPETVPEFCAADIKRSQGGYGGGAVFDPAHT